jgi:hypothetical protein
LSQNHKLSELLLKSINSSLKGERQIIDKKDNWTQEIDANWNKRKITLSIKSRKSNLQDEFTKCQIKKTLFMSIVAGYDNFKISGNESIVSDLILSDPTTRFFLSGNKSSFKLDGNYFIYKCRIAKRNKELLSSIFLMMDEMTKKIDLVVDLIVTQQRV